MSREFLILIAGSALTVTVGSTLIRLHQGTPSVPLHHPNPVEAPEVILCGGGPSWLSESDLGQVRTAWAQHGRRVGPARKLDCSTINEGQPCLTSSGQDTFCEGGSIVVITVEEWASPNHPGETLARYQDGWDGAGETLWATLHLPESLARPDGEPLFKDAAAWVFAHEVGHWWGLGHVVTPLWGPFVGSPSGHLMNASIDHLGWSLEGVPTPD